MSEIVLSVENLSKQYRLGELGTGTLSHDLNRWWHRVRGKEDPYLKVGDVNDRGKAGGSDYVWSLRDITFEVKRGEVLGIIGKNGAGKSTLLKILSQVTTPTTGEVKVKGRIAALLEVGTGFHPELTGRENIFLNGAILGMTKQEIRSKLDEIVDFSGVAKYLDTPVKRYSSGMKVRLGFAVAAHLEPEILIVDEVLAVGDAEFQKKCLGKMKEVSGEGRTVLFVSHNMAAVRNLCTTGIILQSGSLEFRGDSEDACNKYLSDSMGRTELRIDQRKDREGNGIIRITEIYFVSRTGERLNTIISGESAKLVLDYYCQAGNSELRNVVLVLIIKNSSDITQTYVASDEMGSKLYVNKSNGKFEIDFPRLLLRGGSYTLSYLVSIKENNMATHTVLDRMNGACSIMIERGDYWKTGNLNRVNGFIQDATISVS